MADRVAALQQQAESLRAELARVRARAEQPDPASADLERTVAQIASAMARIEARIADLDQRIARLDRAAPAAEPSLESNAPAPAVGRLLPSRPPAVSVYSAPDHRLADFIETPTDDNPDLFPIRISNVTGREAIVGTHPSTRIVEGGPITKDDFGRMNPVRKEVEQTVAERALEVVFSAQNLTRTEKSVSFTAGAGTTTLVLQPGETAHNLTLRSALGAELKVAAGGQIRGYPIRY